MTDAEDTSPWGELKQLLRLVALLFGWPADLLGQVSVARSEARAIRAWLRALEGVARALLLVMAAGLPRPAPGRPRSRRSVGPDPRAEGAAPAETRKSGAEPPEAPGSERWAGVAFRVLPPQAGPHGLRAPSYRFAVTRPLAFRFEALIRVAEGPETYARRLARRLHREPVVAARVLSAAQPRDDLPRSCRDLAEIALSRAGAAARAFLPDGAPGTG